jgi:hypothetical protein
MTSPLLPYTNAYLQISSQGAPSIDNGRFVTTAGVTYVIQCYCVRQDSTGTTTGAEYAPTRQNPGNTLPGVSGEVYLYRGYALRYGVGDLDSLPAAWITISADDVPTWLAAGVSGQHRQGNEQVKATTIERVSGKYGGTAIDQIISAQIKGVPITLRSGDVIN